MKARNCEECRRQNHGEVNDLGIVGPAWRHVGPPRGHLEPPEAVVEAAWTILAALVICHVRLGGQLG
eukprot:1795220-Pyramimonas_sp.AAC.1